MSIFSWLEKACRPLSRRAGLSLIETGIALIVIGLVTVPVLRLYHHDLAKKAHRGTSGKLWTALDGINQYFASGNGAYPCPTDLSLQEGDVGFGKAGNCTLANIRLCSDPLWFSDGGICKTADSVTASIIGGLPFADLRMAESDALDFWDNKIVYAVTFRQTDPLTYATNSGRIQIMSVDDPEDVANGTADGVPDLAPDRYDIFIFSTGENGVGGYTRRGDRLTACGDASDGYEHENCDYDNGDYDNIFFALEDPDDSQISAYSRRAGAAYFDDITLQQEYLPTNTWFQHEDNPLYADSDFLLTGATKVGVGTTRPDTPYEETVLMVVGDIRADVTTSPNGGHLESDAVCDEEDDDCFDPEIITGAVEEMNCFSDSHYVNYTDDPSVIRAVMRIANSEVGCGNANGDNGGENLHVDDTVFTNVTCGGGEIAQGFDASGGLICDSPSAP